MTDLARAIQLAPDHAAAYNQRGMIYAARGEADLALADFNAAIARQPGLTNAYLNRANILVALGKLEPLPQPIAHGPWSNNRTWGPPS